MGSFAIDKVFNNVGNAIATSFLQQFDYQAPQTPDSRKSRMSFRKLKTIEGKNLPDVEFYMDPQAISVSKQIIQQKKLTKGGFVIQSWGHDLTTINVNCVTGNFQPLYGVQMQLPSNLSKTAIDSWWAQVKERWMRGGGPLKVFEKIKEYAYNQRFSTNEPWKGNPMIEMHWEDYIYDGFFSNFNFNLDSGSPFNISFNFTFTATQRRDMSFSDIFGTIDPVKLLGDPLATLQQKVKQTTDVIVSKAEKELSKATQKLPTVLQTGLSNIIDDLPNKMTLW